MKCMKYFFVLCLIPAMQINAAEKTESVVYDQISEIAPGSKTLCRVNVLMQTCKEASIDCSKVLKNPIMAIPNVNPDATLQDFKKHIVVKELALIKSHDSQLFGPKKVPTYKPDDFYVEGYKESEKVGKLPLYTDARGYTSRWLSLRQKTIKPCFCLLNGLKKVR